MSNYIYKILSIIRYISFDPLYKVSEWKIQKSFYIFSSCLSVVVTHRGSVAIVCHSNHKLHTALSGLVFLVLPYSWSWYNDCVPHYAAISTEPAHGTIIYKANVYLQSYDALVPLRKGQAKLHPYRYIKLFVLGLHKCLLMDFWDNILFETYPKWKEMGEF